MAENSKIEWTHHTFNPWWGCEKVSPACQHCYAETWAKRTGSNIWGKNSPRRFFTDTHWKNPLKWNKQAKAEGTRKRVFCASMADVFEDRRDLDESRGRLWELIESTPYLDWLLLTKRANKISALAPWKKEWPENIWLGTTVENQTYAKRRIPSLLKHKAKIHFLSCEPLLGEIDLTPWANHSNSLDWIIAGGESGGGARPMDPEWARSLRDQALKMNTPFHFKQWGHWSPFDPDNADHYKKSRKLIQSASGEDMIWLSKGQAGRQLDGCVHDGFPLIS